MKTGSCKHFNGIQHDICDKNIRYDSFTDGDHVGIVKKIPCFKRNNIDNCKSREFPTDEEIKEYEKKINQWCKAVAKAINIIVEKHKVDVEWENPTDKNKSVKETIECPLCKGNLHYSISSHNGHIWGKCETEKCLSWMM